MKKMKTKLTGNTTWEIEEDLPEAQNGIKSTNDRALLSAVQSKINQGKADQKKYQEELIAYAKSIDGDKDFTKKVHQYVLAKCGGGAECISGATKLLEGTSHPLGKGYTSNSEVDKDIRTGKLPSWVIDPGSTKAKNNIEVGDILQTTVPAYTKEGKEVRGHPFHALPIVEAKRDPSGNFSSLKYFGNQANAEMSTGYHDITNRTDLFSNPNRYQVLKPAFIPADLVNTRDSIASVLRNEDPNFDRGKNFIPRYTDYQKISGLSYTNYGTSSNDPVSMYESSRIEDMYKPLIDKQEELMQRFNLSQEEFQSLVKRLQGIGEQETHNASWIHPIDDWRYNMKRLAGKPGQFIFKVGQALSGDPNAHPFDPANYSQGTWQVKPEGTPVYGKREIRGREAENTNRAFRGWAPESGSVEEAFGTLVDRYINQVNSKKRGTEEGYNEAVNKYKGISVPTNDYLKNVLDYSKNLQLKGVLQTDPSYTDYKGELKAKIPVISIKRGGPGQSLETPFLQVGGMVNNSGYTPGYASFNNPYNIIPSSDITMRNTPFPIHAIADTGEQQVLPAFSKGKKFKGAKKVLEIPLAQSGGSYPMYDVLPSIDEIKTLHKQRKFAKNSKWTISPDSPQDIPDAIDNQEYYNWLDANHEIQMYGSPDEYKQRFPNEGEYNKFQSKWHNSDLGVQKPLTRPDEMMMRDGGLLKAQNGKTINLQDNRSEENEDVVKKEIEWAEKQRELENSKGLYEPSQRVKNLKAVISGLQFSPNPLINLGARIEGTVADATTAGLYALSGQPGKASIDAGQALLNWVPGAKGEKLAKASDLETIGEAFNWEHKPSIKQPKQELAPIDNTRVKQPIIKNVNPLYTKPKQFPGQSIQTPEYKHGGVLKAGNGLNTSITLPEVNIVGNSQKDSLQQRLKAYQISTQNQQELKRLENKFGRFDIPLDTANVFMENQKKNLAPYQNIYNDNVDDFDFTYKQEPSRFVDGSYDPYIGTWNIAKPDVFSRPQQPSEEGGLEYFNKKTGKKLKNGGVLKAENTAIIDPRTDSYYTPSSSDTKLPLVSIKKQMGIIPEAQDEPGVDELRKKVRREGVQFPEVEIVAPKSNAPTWNAMVGRAEANNPALQSSSADIAAALFTTPLAAYAHTPSELLKQGVSLAQGNGLAPYMQTSITDELGWNKAKPGDQPDDGTLSLKKLGHFAVDNGADFVVPLGPSGARAGEYGINRAVQGIDEYTTSLGKTLELAKNYRAQTNPKFITPLEQETLHTVRNIGMSLKGKDDLWSAGAIQNVLERAKGLSDEAFITLTGFEKEQLAERLEGLKNGTLKKPEEALVDGLTREEWARQYVARANAEREARRLANPERIQQLHDLSTSIGDDLQNTIQGENLERDIERAIQRDFGLNVHEPLKEFIEHPRTSDALRYGQGITNGRASRGRDIASNFINNFVDRGSDYGVDHNASTINTNLYQTGEFNRFHNYLFKKKPNVIDQLNTKLGDKLADKLAHIEKTPVAPSTKSLLSGLYANEGEAVVKRKILEAIRTLENSPKGSTFIPAESLSADSYPLSYRFLPKFIEKGKVSLGYHGMKDLNGLDFAHGIGLPPEINVKEINSLIKDLNTKLDKKIPYATLKKGRVRAPIISATRKQLGGKINNSVTWSIEE